MSRVTIKVDPNEDARWWVYFAHRNIGTYGRSASFHRDQVPADIRQEILKRTKPQARKFVEQHIIKNKQIALHDERAAKAHLDQYLKQYGVKLLGEVAKLTGKPMYAKTFTGVFTILGICSYDEDRRVFMVSIMYNMPRQINTICHEIMHFQFLHHYRKYCHEHGLTEEQVQDLKEAMTVLLNEPQFEKFNKAFDQGYIGHQTLRLRIAKYWHERKSYREFLDMCIAATKEEMIAAPKKKR